MNSTNSDFLLMAFPLLHIKSFKALTAVYGTRNLLLDSCRKSARGEGEGKAREETGLFLHERGDETTCRRVLKVCEGKDRMLLIHGNT